MKTLKNNPYCDPYLCEPLKTDVKMGSKFRTMLKSDI